MWSIVSMVVVILLVVFLAVAIILQRKNVKRPPDYYNLFLTGLMWFAIGIPLVFDGSYIFLVVGTFLAGIGLLNKDKWQANRRKWSDLTPKEKSIKKVLMIVLGAFVVAGFIAYFLSIK